VCRPHCAVLIFALYKPPLPTAHPRECTESDFLPPADRLWRFGSLFRFTPGPEAYASASSTGGDVARGVLKKFGLYGLPGLALPLVPEARSTEHVLIVLLSGNIIYSASSRSRRSGRLDLGYSSVMHMGYIFLGSRAPTSSASTVPLY